MIRNDARGFYAAGISFSLVTMTLLVTGFVFLSFMKIVFLERADLELQQEIDHAMRTVGRDAAESSTYEIHTSEYGMNVAFHKERSDISVDKKKGATRSKESGVTYGLRPEHGSMRFCRTRNRLNGAQPMTGESMIGDVTITSFRAEAEASGVHIVLEGQSRRTGHTYRQTAVYPLARKS